MEKIEAFDMVLWKDSFHRLPGGVTDILQPPSYGIGDISTLEPNKRR